MLKKLVLLLCTVALVIGGAVSAQDEETFSLTILHTNDTHSHHEPNANDDGGAARQATVVNQIRGEVDNLLLLDGGDRFTGTLFHQQYRGADSVMIMNSIGYDAMTLGNHEFDDGEDVLAAFIDGLNFPVVTANVDFSESEILAGKVEPYVVLDVNGQQVGIIGLVTPDTPEISSPGDELVFNSDLPGATQTAVDELTAMGVNKIILVTHIGLDYDIQVAENTTGIDIIVGGHSHTLLGNQYVASAGEYPVEVENLDGEPVIIVQAGSTTTYLGRLDVTFDAEGALTEWGGDTIFLSRYITPDAEINDILTELSGPIDELRNTLVGESTVFLVGDRAVCRIAECNLGNLIADTMRWETGAQLAIINGGGIRSNIPAEETPADTTLTENEFITLGEVLTVLPFGNLVSTFELSGADVIAALENGVSQIETGAGRFAQVSGLRYSFDPSLSVGSRVTSVEVQGENGEFSAIDPEATYSVVSNDFMRGGGDGYTMFAENAVNPYDFGRPLDQVLTDYIIEFTPVAPALEGRITMAGGE